MKQLLKRTSEFFKTNYLRLIILAVVLGLFFLFSFNTHIVRLGTSIKSFGINIIYYIRTIFNPEIEAPKDTLEILIEQSGGSIFNLINFDFQNFFSNFGLFFKLFINLGFLNHWWQSIASSLSDFSIYLNILLTLFLIGFMFYKLNTRYKPNDYVEDTKSLTNFKKIGNKLKPVFFKVKTFITNLFSPKWFKVSLILLILFYFQIITTSIDLISNYFLFCANFDFVVLGDLVILILINILPVYFSIPLLFRLILLYWLFDKIRIKKAFDRLHKLSDSNVKFLEDTGNIILFSGASRTGKSAFLTQLTIQYERMIFRPALLNIMLEIERKFPKFNWSKFNIIIDNLPSLKTQDKISGFILKLMNDVHNGKDEFELFNNDLKTYSKWNNLSLETIFNALNDYTICYVFYNFEDPIAVGNYPISFNSIINIKPHYFNVDHFDLFKETEDDFKKRMTNRLFSKINNFDYLKLGIKLNNATTEYYVPDLGAYSFTEMGKERGSTDLLKSTSSKSKTGNRKNDKFNERLRIWSHISTIRYQTLFKVFMDEQDVKGINSDLRKTSETILTLNRKKKKRKLALNGWSIEQTICKWLLQKYDEYNLKRKEIKLNTSLFNYLIKMLVDKVNDYYSQRVNNFAYTEYQLYNVNGSLSDVTDSVDNCSLYLFDKIAYSDRYASTMLRRLFLDQMRHSNLSFYDLKNYSSLTPSIKEYEEQNSYFYNEYFKLFNSKEVK